MSVVGSGGSSGGLLGQRGDFGDLDGRVTEYCNSDDLICNDSAMADVESLATWFGTHTSYQNLDVPGTDTTYTDQIADDLVQDIVNLNDVTY